MTHYTVTVGMAGGTDYDYNTLAEAQARYEQAVASNEASYIELKQTKQDNNTYSAESIRIYHR